MNQIEIVPSTAPRPLGLRTPPTCDWRTPRPRRRWQSRSRLHPERRGGWLHRLRCRIRQSRNSVVGVKGNVGANVILAAGVSNTRAELGGARSGGSAAAVVDNSGNHTNVIIDHHLGVADRKRIKSIQVDRLNFTDAEAHHFRSTSGLEGFGMDPQYEAGLAFPSHPPSGRRERRLLGQGRVQARKRRRGRQIRDLPQGRDRRLRLGRPDLENR